MRFASRIHEKFELIPCVDGPQGSSRFARDWLWFECGHVSGLWRERMPAGPDGFRGATSKQPGGFEVPLVLTECVARRFDRMPPLACP